MIRVLLFLLVPSGLLAQDSLIVSLESRLDAVPDSLKREVRQELSRQYFFYSFKYPDSTEFRQATLAKGLSIAQESRDTLLAAAHHLELTHFLPNDSAVKVLNFYKPILDSISKYDFSNTLASLVYASMSIEILKLSGFKKFLAKLFYGALPEVDYDRALLHLLQVKLAGEFLAITYYRLAECYFALHNHRDALGSLNACLKAEAHYPYIDAYFKREARARLERYNQERR
jgi:tetratricopeptide (TPR) repeat protein